MTAPTEAEVAQAVARKLLAVPIGRLWWGTASSMEASKWRDGCLARGAIAAEVVQHDYGRDNRVIVTLYHDETADHVAGYPIGDEEWLTE